VLGCSTGSAEDSEQQPPQPSGKRPNILLIYADQHRGDALGAAGHPVLQTPHLDSLADEGVMFNRCFASGSVCKPSRASMITGHHPHVHGVMDNGDTADPATNYSHVRAVRDAGYLTALVGKTHLHDGKGHLDEHAHVLESWGFEDILELTGPGESAGVESRWSDWLKEQSRGEPNKYERFRDYIKHYNKNHKHDAQWETRAPDEDPWKLSTDDHLDVFTGRSAAQWLRDYDDERPFYLQVCFPGPHSPFDATSEYRSYDQDDPLIPIGSMQPPSAPLSPVIVGSQSYMTGPQSAAQARKLHAKYYAKITMIDSMVGEIIDALRDAGQLDNTWVVFSSDHGDMLGDHLLIGKLVFFDKAIHVPLIVRPPEALAPTPSAGWSSDALVDQLDMTATIMAMAGVDPGEVTGRSLLTTITEGPDAAGAHVGKPSVLCESFDHAMIRTDRYKLVVADNPEDWKGEDRSVWELYDLDDDPGELVNRVDDPDYQDVRQELLADLQAQL